MRLGLTATSVFSGYLNESERQKYFGAPKDKIEMKLVPGGHIGLFMGSRNLKDAWPLIARWILAQ
jgi:poly(3-hydroxybutyrate) depolymerase